jgi:hypothetical protein
MQVGEVHLAATGSVQRLDIGFQLDEVARDETRCQAHVPERLHQQPAGVAAGPAGLGQRLFRRLHAGLHADEVADVALQALVQADQEVDGALLAPVDAVQEGCKGRCGRVFHQVGRQLGLKRVVVGEGKRLGARLQEEVERVVHRHLGHEVDGDPELGGLVREDQARQVVGERVLLPVDEVAFGLDLERVGQDVGAAVRCRAQPHDLRRESHPAVVLVVGDVVQRDVNRHEKPLVWW